MGVTRVDDAQQSVKTSNEESSSPGLPDGDISRLVRDLRTLAHDHLELAVLETRLSVITLLRMATLAVVTGLVLVSAWLSLVGAAIVGLTGIGLEPVFAMLLLAVINLLFALACWLRIRRLTRGLGWPATQRAIKPAPATAGERADT